MKNTLFIGIMSLFVVFSLAMGANATLWTIGTATYQESFSNTSVNPDAGNNQYKLIYDTDLQITWLDYSAPQAIWGDLEYGLGGQNEWANTLGGSLTVNLNPLYKAPESTNWSTGWRLPSSLNPDGSGPNSGYDVTTSEMGHLFYSELGIDSYPVGGFTTTSELNDSDFNNLIASLYWSGTESTTYPHCAWTLSMLRGGSQGFNNKGYDLYGLAVRSGQVSAVPVPGAIWLLGSGFAGLIGVRRKKKA